MAGLQQTVQHEPWRTIVQKALMFGCRTARDIYVMSTLLHANVCQCSASRSDRALVAVAFMPRSAEPATAVCRGATPESEPGGSRRHVHVAQQGRRIGSSIAPRCPI